MKAFIRELRERHVVKVGFAYLVVAWLVLQMADVIFPAMGLPEWSITLALALLAAGFPIALVLAWIFDLTPHGIQRTQASGDGGGPLSGKSHAASPDATAAAAAVPAPAGTMARSLAVLPLRDMSAERDQGHFCDGLTEELLNVLNCIPDLRVASRTSSFAFRDKDADLAAIAAKLKVTHLLEGSVRKDGNKVRITAQLIELATDSHLWSDNYDRELCDIFAIQDDIAARILDALKLTLGGVSLPKTTTQNAGAYEYYLRGRGFFFTKKETDFVRAVDMFCKATQADPTFIRAWISLAEASAMRAIFVGGGDEAISVSRYASDKAMALAPNRADSLMARGFAHYAAMQLDEADADFARAQQLDPKTVNAWYPRARIAFHQGDTARAIEYFVKATELDPDDWESPLLAIGPHVAVGDLDGARRISAIGVERAERHLRDYPDNPRAYYLSLAGLRLLGKVEQANRYADKALALAPDDSATHYNLACHFAMLGERDRALDLLERSIVSLSWIENDPDLANVRDHPRYKALVDSLSRA